MKMLTTVIPYFIERRKIIQNYQQTLTLILDSQHVDGDFLFNLMKLYHSQVNIVTNVYWPCSHRS